MLCFGKRNETLHVRLPSAVTQTRQKLLDGEGRWVVGRVGGKKQRADCVLPCWELFCFPGKVDVDEMRQDLIPKQWRPGASGNKEAETHFIAGLLQQTHPIHWVPMVPVFHILFLIFYGKPQIHQYHLEWVHCSTSGVLPGYLSLHLRLLLTFLNCFWFVLSLSVFFFVCSMLLSSLCQVLSWTLFLSVKGGKSLPSAISCGYLCLLDWSHGFIYCFAFFSWHRRPSSSPTAAGIHLLLPQPLAWCSFSCPISCDIRMGLCNVLFQYIHF